MRSHLILEMNSVRSVLFVGALVLTLGEALPASADPILSLTASTTDVSVGQTFALDVAIQGVTDLALYDITLLIANTDVVRFLGTESGVVDLTADPFPTGRAVEGSFLSSGGSGTFPFGIYSTLDTIEIVNTVLGPTGVSGDGTLFTLFFSAIAAGTTSIGFGPITLFDSTIDPVTLSGGAIVPDALNGASVTTTANTTVPEPGTLSLMAIGVCATLLRRRRWSNRLDKSY